jgi:hypothetical protein
MRWALVVVALAAVGISLVHIRRDVVRLSHERCQLAREQEELALSLEAQQIRLSQQTTPQQIRLAVMEQSLDLADRTGANPVALTAATPAGTPYR